MKKSISRAHRVTRLSILLLMCCVLISCKKDKSLEKAPPKIKVAKVVSQKISRKDSYTGHFESPGSVQISSRVSGVVTETNFKEGAIVNKGDLLVVIDERPFIAEAAAKQASITQAQARLKLAELQFKRSESLHKLKAISDLEYDQANSSFLQAKAEVAGARADLDVANLNVEWSKVTAPIKGKIGRKLVTEGNIVKAEETVLTVLTSIDPLYIYVDVPEGVFLEYTGKHKAIDLQKANIPCAIALENEKEFSHKGFIDFISNQVNAATGTIQIRCVCENKTGNLIPGMFARVEISAMPEFDAVVVPDSTISTDQNNRYVLIVNAEDTVEYRAVTLGHLVGELRVILSGLQEGETIVIEGIQSSKPGTKIAPEMSSYVNEKEYSKGS